MGTNLNQTSSYRFFHLIFGGITYHNTYLLTHIFTLAYQNDTYKFIPSTDRMIELGGWNKCRIKITDRRKKRKNYNGK